MESRLVLPTLNNENFQRWKYDVKAWLEALDIFDIVDGSKLKPEDAAQAAVWKKNDAKARGVIASTLEELHHSMIRSCETSTEMWNKIVNLFEMSSTNNKVILYQQYYKYKYEPGMNITTYLSGLKVLLQKLKAIDENIEETTIIAKIINDLPSQYENFRHSWNLTSAATPNLTQSVLEQQLLIVENSFKNTESVEAEAFFSNKKEGTKQSFKKFQKKQIICYGCKKEGHFKRNCPNSKSGSKPIYKSKFHEAEGLYAGIAEVGSEEIWYADSAASFHMTRNRDWFTTYEVLKEPINITIANNEGIQACGKGSINVEVFDGKQWTMNRLDEVMHVPEMGPSNLFSMSKACDKGLQIFGNSKTIGLKRTDNNKIVIIGKRAGNVWRLLLKRHVDHAGKATSMSEKYQASSAVGGGLNVWHERLGHVHNQRIKLMAKNEAVHGLNINKNEEFFCKGCVLGKMAKKPFKTSRLRECKSGEFIHSDLCGPMKVESLGKSKYMLVFKDEFSGYRTVYCLKSKEEVYEKFKSFISLVKNETGNDIKRLRTDNGREYVNKQMEELLKEHGIQHEKTVPYNPQMNGKSERENRTLIELAKSMLLAKDLSTILWAEAVSTASYVMNRVINRAEVLKTPYELWFGEKPDITNMKIFGSKAYRHVPGELRSKWEPNAKEMIMVGYTNSNKMYRLYDPESKKIFISRDVVFNEVPSTKLVSSYNFEAETASENVLNVEPSEETESGGSAEDVFVISDSDEEFSDALQEAVSKSVGRPKGSKNKPKSPASERKGHGMNLRPRNNAHVAFMSCSLNNEPTTYEQAMNDSSKDKWKKAMDEEFESLIENDTWELVNLPQNCTPIKSKWVYKIKKNTDGSLRHKARLVARGFSQKEGFNYKETFSPVVRYDSIRTVLAIAALKNMETIQFDVKTAFLYGDIDYENYMEQPEGYEDGTNRVCHLKRSLYGLKQSPRQWNKKLGQFLKDHGFQQCKGEPCVYISEEPNSLTILALYVDDGLLTSTSKEKLKTTLEDLEKVFKITVEETNNFVGLQIERDKERRTISIHQKDYIKQIIHKFGMEDAYSISTPGDPHTKLSKTMGQINQEENKTGKVPYIPYREAIGCLMFAATVSRPDIAFSVAQVSQFLDSPGPAHWNAVKRIFRYLKGTSDFKITYTDKGEIHPKLTGYCDSDFAGDIDSRRSTSGYIFLLNGSPITWMSRKQSIIAQSSTEAEYIALSEAGKESEWLRQLLTDLKFEQRDPLIIYCDNQSAIKLVKNPEYHRRTKHIDVRFHYIRDLENKGAIGVEYISTKEQPADILTKYLFKPGHYNCIKRINLIEANVDNTWEC